MQGAISDATAANTKLVVIVKLDHYKTDPRIIRAIGDYSKHELWLVLLRQVNVGDAAVMLLARLSRT